MNEKSRVDYSILNICAGLGGYVVNFLLGIICRIVFTKTLAIEYLGISGLFTNVLSMLSLAELGIGSAIGYALYKPLATGDKPKITSLMRFYAKCYQVIGIVVALLGIALMPFLHLLIQEAPAIKENIYVVYLLFLFNSASSYFFSYRSALLTAAQQHYLVTGINYAITIGQSIIQTALLFATHNYMLYLGVQIIGGLSYNVIISTVAKRKFPYIEHEPSAPLPENEKKSLMANVRALTISRLSGLLVNQTDNMIISFFNGLITVGIASNYTLLTNTLNTVLNIIFNGISASVGNHNAIEDSDKKYMLFKALNMANFWLFGWGAIGIFLCSTDIVKLLFGEQYALPFEIPLILAINFYMVGMQSAVWTYKSTMGLFRQGRYLLLVTASINLVLSIIFGKLWGLFGILLATAFARAFTNTWYDPYAIHKYGFNKPALPYFINYIKYAITLIVTAALCMLLCRLMDFALWCNVICKVLICSIVPNLMFTMCFARTDESKQLLLFADRIIKKLLLKVK